MTVVVSVESGAFSFSAVKTETAGVCETLLGLPVYRTWCLQLPVQTLRALRESGGTAPLILNGSGCRWVALQPVLKKFPSFITLRL